MVPIKTFLSSFQEEQVGSQSFLQPPNRRPLLQDQTLPFPFLPTLAPFPISGSSMTPHTHLQYLMEAVRGLCSRESITQPTWHSIGGFELCRVFLFRGVCKTQRIRDMSPSCPGPRGKPQPWPHLGIYRPALFHHRVETGRLRWVL